MGFGLLVFWLACSGYTGVIAKAKGYGAAWTVGGFLFGPVALLAATGLPDLVMRKQLVVLAGSTGKSLDGPSSAALGLNAACSFKTSQKYDPDEYWMKALYALSPETRTMADQKKSAVARDQITIRNGNSEVLSVARWRGNSFGQKEWYLD